MNGFQNLPAFGEYLGGLEWTFDISVCTFIIRLQNTLEQIEKQLPNILSTPSPNVLISSMLERLDSLKGIIDSECPKDGVYGKLSCAIFENHFAPNIYLNDFLQESSSVTGKNREELRGLVMYGGDEKAPDWISSELRNNIVTYLKTYHSTEYEVFEDEEPYSDSVDYLIDSGFEIEHLRMDISFRFFEVSIDILEEQLLDLQNDLDDQFGLKKIRCTVNGKRLALFMKALYFSEFVDSQSMTQADFKKTLARAFVGKNGKKLNLSVINKNMKPSADISEDDYHKMIDIIESLKNYVEANYHPK